MKKIVSLFIIIQLTSFSTINSRYSSILKDNWKIQSSAQVDASGEFISIKDYGTKIWCLTEVLSNVLAALVRNGVYKNIYLGENLKSIPKDHTFHLITNFLQETILPIQISSARMVNTHLCIGAIKRGRSQGVADET